jgi:hypothetical protein
LVHADGELPNPIAPQSLEPITWQGPQSGQVGRCVENGQPAGCLTFEALKILNKLPAREGFRPLVFVPDYHSIE